MCPWGWMTKIKFSFTSAVKPLWLSQFHFPSWGAVKGHLQIEPEGPYLCTVFVSSLLPQFTVVSTWLSSDNPCCPLGSTFHSSIEGGESFLKDVKYSWKLQEWGWMGRGLTSPYNFRLMMPPKVSTSDVQPLPQPFSWQLFGGLQLWLVWS